MFEHDWRDERRIGRTRYALTRGANGDGPKRLVRFFRVDPPGCWDSRLVAGRLWYAYLAARSRARGSDSVGQGRISRWRWTAKCIVVLLLGGRENGEHTDCEIAVWDQASHDTYDGPGASWTSLYVAWGWRRWTYSVDSDSTP